MADDEQPDLSEFGPAEDTESDVEAGTDDRSGEGTDPEAADRSDTAPADDGDGSKPARPPVAELDRDERVELGVDLLAHIETASLSLSAVVDRIETVTTDPALTRDILDTAELRGIIEREDGRIRTRRGGTYVRFERAVVEREGDYECRRCGAGLSTGHFVRFEAGELGPFGSSCIKKVLGRE